MPETRRKLRPDVLRRLERMQPARYVAWTTPHELCCPAGHHIKQDVVVLDHVGLRCKHRPPQEVPGRLAKPGPECGRWLYVLLRMTDTVSDPHRVPVFAAEVTYAELLRMQSERMDVQAILAFLGAANAN